MPKLYLSGPMTGLNWAQSESWRTYVKDMFEVISSSIDCYSPGRDSILKHKEGETYSVDCDPFSVLESQRGLSARDKYDCMTCDLMLVNLLGATKPSFGTAVEIGMATTKPERPIVLLMEEKALHYHPMILEYCQFWVKMPSLDEWLAKADINCYGLDEQSQKNLYVLDGLNKSIAVIKSILLPG